MCSYQIDCFEWLVSQRYRYLRGNCVMNKRLLAYTLLGVLIVTGLMLGTFQGAIQRALTLPITLTDQNEHGSRQNTPVQTNNQTPIANQPNQSQQSMTQSNMVALDTFQRTDQPFWGRASDGSQWEGDANLNQAFSIAGASGQIAYDNRYLNAVLGLPVTNVDVTIEGMINQFDGVANIGILARWTDPDNWYKADIDGSHMRLLRQLDGKGSTIKSIDMKLKPKIAYMLRFRALGAMLFVKAWPAGTAEPFAWQLTTSDRAFTSGRVGVRVVMRPTVIINILSFRAVTAAIGNDT
jgi:hypothetical protein